MDLASCADCVHEVFDFKNDTHEDPDEPFVGRAWFAHEWRAIRRRLQNSIVSHQFHIEASTVFFSQPFRFTGDCGWITLYHFLDRLGHKQRCRLLNISVCHPGFASLPEVNPDRQLNWQGLVGLTGDYHDLFDGHMNAFGFGPALRQPYPPLSEDDAWKDRGHFDGTACLLADCSSLTRLTLTLPQFQVPPEQATFRDLGLHPIHSYRWPQGPALQRSVVHLVCSHHSCSDPERLQPCMAEIYEKSSEKQVFQDTSMLRLPLGYRPVTPHTAVRSQEARQFFDTVEREGWVVKQLLYDLRGHYPVAEGSLCVNMKMCRLLRSIDEPNLWYECPGNKYEALEHLEPGHWIFWWMGEEL